MAKGITAFMVTVAVILSISTLSGLGFYATVGADYTDSSSESVRNAADAMIGQEASDQSSGSVLQDFTTSAGTTLATAWEVLANLSGVLQLLAGIPAAMADTVQLFFQITFSITFAAFIRGVVLQ